MLSRSLPTLLIFTLLAAPNAQAVEYIFSGLLGISNQRAMGLPSLGEDGLPDGIVTPAKISVMYVNCVAGVVVARACGRADNASGGAVFLRDDPSVIGSVAADVVDFVNEVCETALGADEIADATAIAIAVYSRPNSDGLSRACVSGIGRF